MAEALARGGEYVCGLVHLMRLVTGHLGVLHQGHFLLLTDLVELLLCFFNLTEVPEEKTSKQFSLGIPRVSTSERFRDAVLARLKLSRPKRIDVFKISSV